jgi:hypothetical protein
MSSSKNIDLTRDFGAGVYQSLYTGDTVSHVGIFRPSFMNCCLSTLLSDSTLPPPRPPIPCVNKNTVDPRSALQYNAVPFSYTAPLPSYAVRYAVLYSPTLNRY